MEQKKQLFLNGYRSKAGESDELESMFPACRRFANLYGYVRVFRSTAEHWLHEPEWMSGLRARLSRKMTEQAEQFGKVVNS